MNEEIVFTEHAKQRLRERNLEHSKKKITNVLSRAKDILNEDRLFMRIGNISLVAAKREKPTVITLWKTE